MKHREDFDVIKLEYGDFDPSNVVGVPKDALTFHNGEEKWVHGSGFYIVSRKGAASILAGNPPTRSCMASDGAFDTCLRKEHVYVVILL